MNTKPDLSKRIELVSNRITYLVDSIQGVQQEIERYTQGLDALKKLVDLYNQAGDDPIDMERNAFFCDGEPEDRAKRKKVPNGTADFVFETLVLAGPMKTGKIIYKTGLEPKQVYNAVYYLKMRGLIEKQDCKWRIKR